MIPKEHGAWAMLLVPLIIGAAISGSPNLSTVLFLFAAASAFAARYPLSLLWRGRGKPRKPGDTRRYAIWFALYSLIGIGSLLAIIVLDRPLVWVLVLPLVLLLPVYLLLQQKRMDRSAAAQLLVIAGLSWTAALAYYTGTGNFGLTAIMLWLLCFIYNGASVFWVRLRVRRRPGNPAASEVRNLALYLIASAFILAALSAFRLAPVLAPSAFLPLYLKSLVGMNSSTPPPSIKRIGLVELAHSLLFAAILISIYYLF